MSIIDTLIYDRTSEDLKVAQDCIKNNEPLPNDNLRYAWDYRALNRTEEAMEYVNEIFKELGYFRNMEFKKDWFADEITQEHSERYINNLKVLRNYLTMPSTTPDVPNTINGMSITRANEIEKIIHDIDVVLEALQNNFVYSGVCGSGQDRIWQQRFRGRLYKKLEYLSCDGNQYIDTGVKTKQTLKIVCEFSTSVRGVRILFGGRKSNASNGIVLATTARSSAYTAFGGSTVSKDTTILLVNGEKHVVVLSEDTYTIDDEPQIRNTPETLTQYYKIYLGTWNNGGAEDNRMFEGNIYSFKIYDGDTLIRDFIPCLNNNGVVCFLDKVQNKFYYNQGTGDFIAGN